MLGRQGEQPAKGTAGRAVAWIVGTHRFCLRNEYNWLRNSCQVAAGGLLLGVTRNGGSKGLPAETYER